MGRGISTYQEAVLIPISTGGNSSHPIPRHHAIQQVPDDTSSGDPSQGTDTCSAFVSSRLVRARAPLRHTSETHATPNHLAPSPLHHLDQGIPFAPSRTSQAQSSTHGLIHNPVERGVRMREIVGGVGGSGMLLLVWWEVPRGGAV